MTVSPEIKKIIESYAAEKSGEGINRQKLESIFSAAWLSTGEYRTMEEDLARIRAAAGNDARHSRRSQGSFGKTVLKIMIPASAAAMVVAALYFNFFTAVKPGARIVSVSGDAYLMNGGDRVLLKAGAIVHESDSVETGSRAVIELAYRNRVIVKALEKSTLTLGRLAGGDEIDFAMTVSQGRFLVYVQKLTQGDSIRVATPWSMALVRGTVFGIDVSDAKKTVYEIYDGKVRVTGRIPSGGRTMDRESARVMERYFNDNPVVLEKNSRCSLEHNTALLGQVNRENVREMLKIAFAPRVAGSGSERFSMTSEALKFIGDIKKIDAADPALDGVTKNIVQTARSHDASSAAEKKRKRSDAYISYLPGPRILLSVAEDGMIEATDLRKVLWTVKIPGKIVARGLDVGETLYAATAGGRVFAVDLNTGKILWGKQLDEKANDTVYVAVDDTGPSIATGKGMLYKMRKNGEVLWKAHLNDVIVSSPVIGRDLIFVAMKSGNLVGVDRVKGVQIIRRSFQAPVASVALREGTIHLVTSNGAVFCYSVARDEILWSYNLNVKSSYRIFYDAADIYVFDGEGGIMKLDGNGKLQWKTEVGNPLSGSPEFDEKHIAVTSDMAFFQIDKRTGAISWSLVMPGIVSKNVASSKTSIFLLTEKKGVTVLKK